MSGITQALYVSVATFEETNVSDSDILTVARARNASNDVTGFLLRTRSHFLQLLEGDRHAVAAILNSIRSDTRHYDMVEWPLIEVETRAFGEWSMGYGKTDREDMLSFALKNGAMKETAEVVPRLKKLSINLAA